MSLRGSHDDSHAPAKKRRMLTDEEFYEVTKHERPPSVNAFKNETGPYPYSFWVYVGDKKQQKVHDINEVLALVNSRNTKKESTPQEKVEEAARFGEKGYLNKVRIKGKRMHRLMYKVKTPGSNVMKTLNWTDPDREVLLQIMARVEDLRKKLNIKLVTPGEKEEAKFLQAVNLNVEGKIHPTAYNSHTLVYAKNIDKKRFEVRWTFPTIEEANEKKKQIEKNQEKRVTPAETDHQKMVRAASLGVNGRINITPFKTFKLIYKRLVNGKTVGLSWSFPTQQDAERKKHDIERLHADGAKPENDGLDEEEHYDAEPSEYDVELLDNVAPYENDVQFLPDPASALVSTFGGLRL